jgi:hypothetical protein
MNEQKDHSYSLPTPSSSSGTFKYPDPFLLYIKLADLQDEHKYKSDG